YNAETAERAEKDADLISASSASSVSSATSAFNRRGQWRESPMALVAPGTDQWAGRFEVDALGWHEYTIVAWVDRFRSWRRDLEIKAAAGQDISVELLEGSMLVARR